MDCIITLISNKGNPVVGRTITINNQTNLMALIYDLRASAMFQDDQNVAVRAVVDIALNLPGVGE